MRPVCVIVDGYKFSHEYAVYCRSKNIDCIHVMSTPTPIEKLQPISTWRTDDYVANFTHSGNLDKLVEELKSFNIKAIIPSTEHGVELADELATYFKVPHNGIEKSNARRDKFLMIEALKENDIPTVNYFKSSDPKAILHWVQQNTTWPVVVKPLKSAGTDGVFICESGQQLLHYCHVILQMKNKFDESNQEVLVQAFLNGTEYVINTVSHDGQPYVTDIWQCKKRYSKEISTVLYETETVLPYEGKIQSQLINYIERVLKALEIYYGAGHAEVMLTPDGPILIEIGARVSGGLTPAHSTFLGHNQLELNVDSYLDAATFARKTQNPYRLKKHATLVLLASTKEGIIKRIPLLDIIKKLRSLHSATMNLKPGDRLKKTIDLQSTPGKIMLVHDDPLVIERDYQTIMKAETNGFILEE